MGLLNELFKSRARREKEREEREIEKARAERQAKDKARRELERGIREAEDKIKEYGRRNEESWERARAAFKAGRKAAASMELSKYRANALLVDQFQRKIWVLEQYQIQLESAATDESLTTAISSYSKMIDVDPSKVAATFEGVQSKLEAQTEIDDVFNQIFDEETRRSKYRDSETLPDLDGLMSELETEAALEVGGAGHAVARGGDVATEVASGRERLKNILDRDDRNRP